MERSARRYARFVLAVHIALFVLVLLVIALTLRVLYQAARTQAIEQAEQTQELLARQTGLSIKNYYDSITGVLELLQPGEDEPVSPETSPDGRPLRRRDAQAMSARQVIEDSLFARMAPAIWRSLSERISLLFVLDVTEPMQVVKIVGAGQDMPLPDEVVRQTADWLAQVQRASVSPYIELEHTGEMTGARGAHLVCVPMRGQSRLLMVAVVPISRIERSLLADVNKRPTTGSMLIDEDGTIVSSSRAGITGLNVMTDVKDPRTRSLAQQYLERGGAGTEIFASAEVIGDVRMSPAMSTIQPVELLGKRWTLIISSSLENVDQVVGPIFRDAMLWAGGIMLAMTTLLTSTAVQTIRSRVRLERVQHDVLNRELTQAREIQLAWLPRNDDDPPWIDLSAVNEPATQISGDFYNWFQLCDGRTVVVIGDVTGHGMAAAFLMATTQLLIRTTMPRCSHPGECLVEANRQLCMQSFNGQFVTMLLLVIDVHTGIVELANAGHPPPLAGQGEHFEELSVEPQIVLGVDPNAHYSTQQFTLARGSAMVLYTDGVLDAQDSAGQRFSREGLLKSLYGRYEHAHAIIDHVVDAVDAFRGPVELPDDLTLVAIQLQEAPLAASAAGVRGSAC
jgi:serine phosphatase RsbU (regulator of sigma subunit)